MESGPFVAGEILADTLSDAVVGSFLLTTGGPVWIVGITSPMAPGRIHPLAVPLSGDRAFLYPDLSPVPRNGLRIAKRVPEITIGNLVGNADPLPGDLGIAADGQMVVAVRLADASGFRDLMASLVNASVEDTLGPNNYVWVREWRLDLVSPGDGRKVTLIDRT